MNKTIYLTYGDGVTGVYHSQVIDVVKFINNDIGKEISLVAIISLRNFFNVRKEIKASLPTAKVFPMFPKLRNIHKNKITIKLLYFIMKFNQVIARGPLAAYLAQTALKNKNVKIIYDGRGANKEEVKEYNILDGALTLEDVEKFERLAVMNSDFRIAVSRELVKYWEHEFNYKSENHSIIPCMLGASFENTRLDKKKITEKRKKLGFNNDDIILIYSGSIAGWQSFDFLKSFIESQLKINNKLKIIFLSKTHSIISNLEKKYKNRVFRYWLSINAVFDYLAIGDYGILFRENTVTNKVASPVKFAEYLSAGLKVLISENLGDYTEFVKKYDCGYIANDNINLEKPDFDTKVKISGIAKKFFTKKNNIAKYDVIL